MSCRGFLEDCMEVIDEIALPCKITFARDNFFEWQSEFEIRQKFKIMLYLS